MYSQGDLEWWAFQMILGSGLSCFLGFNLFRQYRKMINTPDAQWKKHVDDLLAKGIDPSYVKRTPEWEESQAKDIQKTKYLAIALGIVIPIMILSGTAIHVLFNWNTLPRF